MARGQDERRGNIISSVVADSPGESAMNVYEVREASLHAACARGRAAGVMNSAWNAEDAEPGGRDDASQPVGAVRRRLRGKTKSTQSANAAGGGEQPGGGCPGEAVRHAARVDGEMNTVKFTSLGRDGHYAAGQAADGTRASSAAGRPPSQARSEG